MLRVRNACTKDMKKNLGYEIVFEGMKKYLSVGMKKTNFCKKKFHTLGYENIGCFFLMYMRKGPALA